MNPATCRHRRQPAVAATPFEEPPTASVAEAAALLGVSKATIYEAIARGEIRSIKIGGRKLIPRAYLYRLLEGR